MSSDSWTSGTRPRSLRGSAESTAEVPNDESIEPSTTTNDQRRAANCVTRMGRSGRANGSNRAAPVRRVAIHPRERNAFTRLRSAPPPTRELTVLGRDLRLCESVCSALRAVVIVFLTPINCVIATPREGTHSVEREREWHGPTA